MFSVSALTSANPDAKRLFDALLSPYNKLVRPVMNVTDAVTVKFKLKLSQLIDVVSAASSFNLKLSPQCNVCLLESPQAGDDDQPLDRAVLV